MRSAEKEQTRQEMEKSEVELKFESDNWTFSMEGPFMLSGESPIMRMVLKNILDLVRELSLKCYCPSL
jgi:hypothetical protein